MAGLDGGLACVRFSDRKSPVLLVWLGCRPAIGRGRAIFHDQTPFYEATNIDIF